uniref:Acetaldehyde dehydrogenase n=1 Tax=Spirochaeta aurantia TaxID=147 RepID=ACDH_SPIAU|nr:RecName: Full=Acetaldehyde dehydrogenase; AltName: Full=Acetaldehyde dehydrogenase [acetylating] [Spirochaeta aurantia]
MGRFPLAAKPLQVAILGTGNIGTDLLLKIQRSQLLKCVAFVGRSSQSSGMVKARSLGVPCSDLSIEYFRQNGEKIDLVFDATSAKDHLVHAPILRELGIRVIDLTPAKVGKMCIPAVHRSSLLNEWNLNMVTCGGQASSPLAWAIGQTQGSIEYLEVVSSIASKSAGPATRLNLDEYIHTTEKALAELSGAKNTKAILVLNPAEPCIDMQTTVFAKVDSPDLLKLQKLLSEVIPRTQAYVPGYQVALGPIVDNGRISIMVRVRGVGDYLPEYAGNLDIINCAAIAMAEEYAKAAHEQ